MLTVAQASKRLGLTEHTLRVWLSRGKLSYFKIGRSVRLSEEEVTRVLAESLIPARVNQRPSKMQEARA